MTAAPMTLEMLQMVGQGYTLHSMIPAVFVPPSCQAHDHIPDRKLVQSLCVERQRRLPFPPQDKVSIL